MIIIKKNRIALILGFCVALAYLLPIHQHPFRTYYNDLVVFIALIFSVSLLAKLTSTNWKINFLIFFPFTLILLITFSYLRMDGLGDVYPFFPISYLLFTIISISVGSAFGDDMHDSNELCNLFASTLLFASLISVLFQLLQITGLDASPVVMHLPISSIMPRPYANVAQPNQLALLLCMGLASVNWCFEKQKLNWRYSIFFTILLLFGLSLTQSRIGWIIVPVFAVIVSRTTLPPMSHKRLVVACLLILYIVFVLSLPYIFGFFDRSGGSAIEHVGGRSERMGLWMQAWSMAASHPWLGVGWGRFGIEQVRIAADFPSSTYAEHAHNIILNFAAELGWPATVCFFAGLGWWFYQACIKPRQTAVVQFAMLYLIAVAVHSMVEFPLWYGYVLFPTAILMGILHQMRWPRYGIVLSKMVIAPSLLIVVFITGFVTWDYQRVVKGFNVLRWEQSGTKVDVRLLEQPEFTFFPQFFVYFKLMKIEPAEGMSKETIAYVEHWTPRFGFVHILNKMAEIYVLNGAPEKAERMMQTLQRLHPDLYPDYFDYWKAKGNIDARYRAVFVNMPRRDAP